MNARQQMEEKIKEGFCKLVKPKPGPKNLWQIFYNIIQQEDKSLVDDMVCCVKCTKVFYYTGLGNIAHLTRHTCYQKAFSLFKQPKKNIVSNINYEMDIIRKSIQEGIEIGIYKLVDNLKSTDVVWSKFAFIANCDESILKEMVRCRQCEGVLKYDEKDIDNLKQHSCFPVMSAEQELEVKIKTGAYTLVECTTRRNELWRILYKIAEEDGSVVNGYVCCIKCKQVLKFTGSGSTVRLKRHGCFKQYLTAGLNDSVEENERLDEVNDDNNFSYEMEVIQKSFITRIRTGFYKLKANMESQRPIWSTFAYISKNDGSILPDFVCCRQCWRIMKYNCHNDEDRLRKHKCFYQTYEARNSLEVTNKENPVTKNDTNTDNNNDELQSICVKEEVDYQHSTKDNLHQNISINTPLTNLNPVKEEEFIDEFIDITSYRPIETKPSQSADCSNNCSQEKENLNAMKNDHSFDYEMEIIQKCFAAPIRSGFYKLKANLESKSHIWSTFAYISKKDGSIMPEFVCCRQCLKIMKYNGPADEDRLRQHHCFYKTYGATNQCSNNPTIEEDLATQKNNESQIILANNMNPDNGSGELQSICVKEEITYHKYSIESISTNSPLMYTIPVKDEEFIDEFPDLHANRPIEINEMESTQQLGGNQNNLSSPTYIKEEND